MKIAYIIYSASLASGKFNGVRSQAETWAALLRRTGHCVDLINNWGDYDWSTYDAIHFFGGCYDLVADLFTLNNKLYWSPIVDPPLDFNYTTFDFLRKIRRWSGGRLYGKLMMEESAKYIKKIFVRSEFEMEHLMRTLHLPYEKFALVPLSVSSCCHAYTPIPKEQFCLHISSIYQSRKNVIRLIEASKKYNFKLVLAGNKGNESQYRPIKDAIGNSQNIDVLGIVSEEQKIDLYKKAKVFCLPSLMEGVGIVALDAAFYGCEIAITNIPGPKEYYFGNCVEFNPNSVDSIGQSVVALMSNRIQYQPQLSNAIKEQFSGDNIAKKIIISYN